MSAVVSLRNVAKSYTRGKQTVEVLHSLNLEIPEGEFLALMGPSGSGKTTLLNLIGGLDKPTQGEVNVAGERIDNLTSGQLAKWRARHVGFIFQFYNLMPMLTAEKNVSSNAWRLPVPSSPTPACSSAMNRRAILTDRWRKKFLGCCNS